MQGESRTISSIFALAAFAVAAITGALHNIPTGLALTRALAAMLVCQLVGAVVGRAVEHIVRERIRQYEQSNPVPQVSAPILEVSPAVDAENTQG